MQGNSLDIILLYYTVRGKCFQFQPFQWIMKRDSLIYLFTLYKSSIGHNIDLLVILFYPKSSTHFLHATADVMPAKTAKVKVLHYLEACFQVLTSTNEPVANVVDGNYQLYVLSRSMFCRNDIRPSAKIIKNHQ